MDELYQSQILALARVARASEEIAHPTHKAHVRNPTCGDEIYLNLCLNATHIEAFHVEVSGCALCEAGAGLLAQQAQAASLSDIMMLGGRLEAFLADKEADSGDNKTDEALLPFTAVRAVKNRHKCVTLAFKALGTLAPITT
jgi:nitrogen fixation NifU-like protein